MRRGWLAIAALLLSACGRYADFTLPPLAGGDPHLTFVFDARPEPVLPRGAFSDVLNPSVVFALGRYWNFYSAFDGRRWHTRLAESSDGLSWQDRGAVLSPDLRSWEGAYIAANGAALYQGGQFRYWYQAGERGRPSIGLAHGADAAHLSREAAPVLDHGPYGSWDEFGVADPYVIRIGVHFYLYYLGQDRARPTRQRIGVARSEDGVHWTRLRSNPVLGPGAAGAFDEAGLGEPAVWSYGGFYWMLYTGRDAAENRRLGLARSTDGVHWDKLPAVFAGAEAWNGKVLCDPTVLVEGDAIRVWFGAGDVASPDENLHGQIGFANLSPVR